MLLSVLALALTPWRSVGADWELPDTDAGLPGAGPVRRYDWFRKVWNERRGAWAGRAEQDRQSVVFLGDSITQGSWRCRK